MEKLKKAALDTIEENKELIASVADQIWEYAELSLQEVRSAALYCKMLKELGFAVEEGVCSISTAFVASYGSGRSIVWLPRRRRRRGQSLYGAGKAVVRLRCCSDLAPR